MTALRSSGRLCLLVLALAACNDQGQWDLHTATEATGGACREGEGLECSPALEHPWADALNEHLKRVDERIEPIPNWIEGGTQ